MFSFAIVLLFVVGLGIYFAANEGRFIYFPAREYAETPESYGVRVEPIDIAAADVAVGATSIDARAEAAIGQLLDIASGSLTFGEIVGEGAEVVSRLGPSI